MRCGTTAGAGVAIGGAGDGAWRGTRRLWCAAALIVLGVATDDTTQFAQFVTTSGVASATIRIAETRRRST